MWLEEDWSIQSKRRQDIKLSIKSIISWHGQAAMLLENVPFVIFVLRERPISFHYYKVHTCYNVSKWDGEDSW